MAHLAMGLTEAVAFGDVARDTTTSACLLIDSKDDWRSTAEGKFRWMSVVQAGFISYRR